MTLRVNPIHLAIGLTLWFTHFVIVYGGAAVGCEISEAGIEQGPFTWVSAFVLIVTLLFIPGLLWLGWLCHRQTPAKPNSARFIMRLSAVLYFFSALAVLLVGLQSVIFPPCL